MVCDWFDYSSRDFAVYANGSRSSLSSMSSTTTLTRFHDHYENGQCVGNGGGASERAETPLPKVKQETSISVFELKNPQHTRTSPPRILFYISE
uniref:Uncharacterized protein n=1 Tax=Ditylenchus dipsaci TaxID=166011 RepID=A0A915D940_9BILA